MRQKFFDSLFCCALNLLIQYKINPALSFFLYTLTTKSFRNEFIRACKDLLFKTDCCRQSNNSNEQQRRNTNGSIISLPLTDLSKTQPHS